MVYFYSAHVAKKLGSSDIYIIIISPKKAY